MKCGNCGEGFHFQAAGACVQRANDEQTDGVELVCGFCPECLAPNILLNSGIYHCEYGESAYLKHVWTSTRIYPQTRSRLELPEEVPEPYRVDYREAQELLNISPKASAAMSRRLLQQILRERYQIRCPSLSGEIDAFIQLPGIPSELADAVDAIRHIGNFAAHPEKDLATGAIVEVEPGEAEWSLDTLESLLDVAFVQPKRLQSRREVLNQKLASLGKPQLRGAQQR
jgi:Domain of unknown function (DUF4145)